MKNFILICLLTPFFFSSCGDDEPSCDTTDIASVLAGSWNESPVNGIGDEVTFNSDMSGSCTMESIFLTEVNGNTSTDFTWAFSADGSTLDLSYPNSLGISYNVVTVECDDIELELFGFKIELSRK